MLSQWLKQWFITQLLLGYIFIVSGLLVNFLMLCSLIIWPFSRSLYRRINSFLAWSIWSQIVFYGQWWSGSDIEVVGPKENSEKYFGKEHGLVIMNHKYDIDWLMGWILAERCRLLGSTKVFVKDSIRFVPVIGWMWYFTESLFVKRDYEKDKKNIKEQLADLSDYPPDLNVWILLFAEGTRFTEKKLLVSNEVARKKGLPELKHHLLPRTKGFVLSMNGLRGKVPAIYNCVIGFKDGAKPTLNDVVYAKKRCTAQLRITRIPLSEVPEDEEGAANWLIKKYQEMDDVYEEFVQNGEFSGPVTKFPRQKYDLYMWLFWAMMLCCPLIYYVGKVFIFGSLFVRCGVIAALTAVEYTTSLMKGTSETKKGSEYGETEKGEPKKTI